MTHTNWSYDSVHAQWFPLTTWIYAQNDDSVLIVKEETIATEFVLPPPELALPLVPLIYEQTAEFSGVLWKKNAAGGWTLATSFGGGGFKEYTSVTPPPPR